MKKVLMLIIVGLATALWAPSGMAAEIMGVDIHGFISQGYLSSSENNFTDDNIEDDFIFSEMGLNFGKELNDNLRLGIQLFAKDFTELSNNEIKIDWAYADYRAHEMLGFRFGQIKFPHGLYSEIRDIDMLRTSIFLPESVYQEISYDLYSNDLFLSLQGISSRDLYLSLQGVGVYGYIDLSALGGLSYQAMYGTQNIDPNSSISDRQLNNFKAITPDSPIDSNIIENDNVEVDFRYAGNILWDTPLDGLRLGASLNNIKMQVSSHTTAEVAMEVAGTSFTLLNSGDRLVVDYDKLENRVFSMEYTWDKLILMAEYLMTTKDYEISSEAFDRIPELGKTTATNTSNGWYAGGAYRFTDWLELGAYYSQSRYDETDSNTNFSAYFFTEFDDTCATARFDINEFWNIKVEAHKIRATYPVYASYYDLAEMESTIAKDEWYMYAAKMTVAF